MNKKPAYLVYEFSLKKFEKIAKDHITKRIGPNVYDDIGVNNEDYDEVYDETAHEAERIFY